MTVLKPWQWLVLALPIAILISGLVFAAGMQLQAWGLSGLWAIVPFLALAWRWLLVRWTKPAAQLEAQLERAIASLDRELQFKGDLAQADRSRQNPGNLGGFDRLTALATAQATLQETLQAARTDRPLWEDWLSLIHI